MRRSLRSSINTSGRSNVAPLAAEGYRVYAIDLVGFGSTDKPVMDYDSDAWSEQCAAFLREVAGCGGATTENGESSSPSSGSASASASANTKRALVAGNSIGGFTALALAATHPDLVSGVASLNGAGRFADPPEAAAAARAAEAAERERLENDAFAKWVAELKGGAAAAAQRLVIGAAFVATKQPARIQQVLRQVYPVFPSRCDDDLVASIEFPARDPNAPEVFYRIVKRNGNGPPREDRSIDALLSRLECPLLLCWGESDPWIVSATADRVEQVCGALGVAARRVSIDAGHCPQDENPTAVNAALLEFAGELY
jgi:pimeloyl-ACP methyl ester carboxylesterase